MPIKSKKVVNPKRKPASEPEMQECDCPFCPLIEYGKPILINQARVLLTDFVGDTFNANICMDDDLPKSLSKSFNNLMLFARNNKKLKLDHILIIYMGVSVITITRYAEHGYGITFATTPVMNDIKTKMICVEVPL